MVWGSLAPHFGQPGSRNVAQLKNRFHQNRSRWNSPFARRCLYLKRFRKYPCVQPITMYREKVKAYTARHWGQSRGGVKPPYPEKVIHVDQPWCLKRSQEKPCLQNERLYQVKSLLDLLRSLHIVPQLIKNASPNRV